MNVPVSYVALLLGGDPTVTMIISIMLSIVAMVARSIILKGMMNFPYIQYIFLVFKILLLSVVVVVGMKLILPNEVDNFAGLVVSSIVILITVTLLYGIILSNSDRQYVLHFVKSKVKFGSK